MVPPGNYTAKLTFDSQSLEGPIEILMDPRVKDEGLTEAEVQAEIEAIQRQVYAERYGRG